MAQVLNLIEARVKFTADKVWQSEREGGKDYVSLKCEVINGTSPSGKDPVVYANVGSPEQSTLAAYRKGDPVQLAYDGKKYSIVGSASTLTTANNTTPPQAAEPKTKEATKEKAEKWAQIYADIFNKLVAELPLTTPPETIGSAASTVFIALTRN